jgi:Fur family transcriptional regulator, peroxide stress response regulator
VAVSKAKLKQRINRFAETCARAGLKVTHQRTEIFREVAGSDEHPDAETVYQQVCKRVTGISRDTVYRTLATLEGKGLIRRTGILGGPVRYDANADLHHHFVCKVCGLVKDFSSEALDDLPIPKTVEAFGRVEGAQVQVRGICLSCARPKSKGRRRPLL